MDKKQVGDIITPLVNWTANVIYEYSYILCMLNGVLCLVVCGTDIWYKLHTSKWVYS